MEFLKTNFGSANFSETFQFWMIGEQPSVVLWKIVEIQSIAFFLIVIDYLQFRNNSILNNSVSFETAFAVCVLKIKSTFKGKLYFTRHVS